MIKRNLRTYNCHIHMDSTHACNKNQHVSHVNIPCNSSVSSSSNNARQRRAPPIDYPPLKRHKTKPSTTPLITSTEYYKHQIQNILSYDHLIECIVQASAGSKRQSLSSSGPNPRVRANQAQNTSRIALPQFHTYDPMVRPKQSKRLESLDAGFRLRNKSDYGTRFEPLLEYPLDLSINHTYHATDGSNHNNINHIPQKSFKYPSNTVAKCLSSQQQNTNNFVASDAHMSSTCDSNQNNGFAHFADDVSCSRYDEGVPWQLQTLPRYSPLPFDHFDEMDSNHVFDEMDNTYTSH
eukprot:872348_1